MNRINPGAFAKKTFFVNSGAEGWRTREGGPQLHQRGGIICYEDAFHGRTLLAMSLTSKVQPYKDTSGRTPPRSIACRTPTATAAVGKSTPGCNIECATFLEDFFKRYVDPSTVAALLVEPILGEGGFVMPPQEYYPDPGQHLPQVRHLVIATRCRPGSGAPARCSPASTGDRAGHAWSPPSRSPRHAARLGDRPRRDHGRPDTGALGGTFGGNRSPAAARSPRSRSSRSRTSWRRRSRSARSARPLRGAVEEVRLRGQRGGAGRCGPSSSSRTAAPRSRPRSWSAGSCRSATSAGWSSSTPDLRQRHPHPDAARHHRGAARGGARRAGGGHLGGGPGACSRRRWRARSRRRSPRARAGRGSPASSDGRRGRGGAGGPALPARGTGGGACSWKGRKGWSSGGQQRSIAGDRRSGCNREGPVWRSTTRAAAGGEVRSLAAEQPDRRSSLRRHAGRRDRRLFANVKQAFGRLDVLVHCVAFAKKEDLDAEFLSTSRDGFKTALDISAYSLTALAQRAAPPHGGGRQHRRPDLPRVGARHPGLQRHGRGQGGPRGRRAHLAHDLGKRNIRVNGISSGPISTLAARGVPGFTKMLQHVREHAPLPARWSREEPAEVATRRSLCHRPRNGACSRTCCSILVKPGTRAPPGC